MNRGYNEAVTRWACEVVGIARQLDWGESVDVVSRSVLSAWIAVLAVGAAVCSMPILADEATIAGRTFVLPDGFTIELVAAASPLVDRPIAASFDERGILYVTDSSGSNEKVQTQLKKRPHRIVQLEAVLQLVKGGDLKRGHHLFRSAKAACRSCHSFGYLGGEVGPDLTYLGSIRTECDLLEAILFPSASFVRSYETPVAVKTDGSALSGVCETERIVSWFSLWTPKRSSVSLSRRLLNSARARSPSCRQGSTSNFRRRSLLSSSLF